MMGTADEFKSDLFKHMTSFQFKTKLSREKVARIGRVVAHEQLVAAALAPEGKLSRLKFWSRHVRRLGWPDGFQARERPVLTGEVL